jgi:D-amino-acid dehydrogenase
MGKSVAIIGAGISGICSAYYLYKSGYEVSVFDSSELNRECSYGNAGLIVPSHFETLANPGILKKGIKWMLNPNSPFFLKPRCDLKLFSWLYNFNSFCTNKHVENNKHFLRDINLYSLELYKELYNCDDFEFDLKENGLLMLCQKENSLLEEEEVVKSAQELGLKAKILNEQQIKELEPNVSFNAIGASYFEDDSTIQPYDFMMSIKKYLIKNGVTFHDHCTIKDFEICNNEIESIVTSKGEEYYADEFVLTSGIFSCSLAKKLNLNLLMQAGKGFSFVVNKNEALDFKTPMILVEQKVAVTPYDSYVRFGGTMMISGNDLSINNRRVNNIKKHANNYINNLNIQDEDMNDIWAGLRPCSPDGLPYIGKCEISNLVVATGHAMMGVSLGPATGKIVTDLISGTNTKVDINKMNLYRF